jgi:hypothetical protein
VASGGSYDSQALMHLLTCTSTTNHCINSEKISALVKHLAHKEHFVRQHRGLGLYVQRWVPTGYQVADVLTTKMDTSKFNELSQLICDPRDQLDIVLQEGARTAERWDKHWDTAKADS